MDALPEEDFSGSWRRGWASVGAFVATLMLIGLVVIVTMSNHKRDAALDWERHTYDVMLLTRTLDATMARSEASLGRYVLDERQPTGMLYYDDWTLAGRQIAQLRRLVRSNPAQRERIDVLDRLYQKRSQELASAALGAAGKKGSGGVPLFYQAGLLPTGPAIRAQLDEIARHERDDLRIRMARTGMFADRADKFAEWLGWLGVLIGVAAIALGLAAYRAISERLVARREADSEASRAHVLEAAVLDRTRELRDANERLLAEAAERAAAEAQLRQVQKMEAVGQLTGGIAHDFNNMLAVVIGGLDLARRRLRSSKREVEFHLDNAMEGATRAAALTRRMLAFARSEPLLPEAVAPANLIEDMLDLVDRSIGERIVIQTRFADHPWNVWVDVNQLENAILNLAVNARDAMDGEGRLEIAIDNVTLGANEVGELGAGDYVRITIGDDGVGMTPDILERVFEPFFTTKAVGKGTGLGLSQIFGFARQSGGDIAIASTPGIGTEVSLYLPRSKAKVKRQSATIASLTPRPRRVQPVVPATILVVEDDPRVSRATVSSLEELGHRPIACSSGREALEILEAHDEIELVVSDVMMPEMTGPELIREMGVRHPDVAVLFVTGYVGEASDSEELGGYDILRKPFTVSALSDAVAKALASVSEPPLPSAAAAAG